MTVPGPGSGVGTSLMTKGESFDSWMKAFIVLGSGGEDMVKTVLSRWFVFTSWMFRSRK